MATAYSREDRLNRLRLIRSENIGPVTFHQLLARFGTAAAALTAIPELAKQGGRGKPLKLASLATATAEVERVAALGAKLLFHGESDYPAALAACDDAPPVLCVKGDIPLLRRPCIALVGARNASLNAQKMADQMAKTLAEAGVCVVSGLARGIDGAAHRGGLAGGATAAVIAGGIDTVYPPEHENLQIDIATRGVLIAEMPPGTQPQARHFPRRNRVIAGLSAATVVIEAAEGSGSLISAQFAADYGREVMAVPGSPLDPRAKGSNKLLKQGATLVEDAADVLAALPALGAGLAEPPGAGFRPPPPVDPAESELARARPRIVEMLSPSPVAVDELLRQCQFSPAVVQTVLLELELAGRLERHPGGQVALLMGR